MRSSPQNTSVRDQSTWSRQGGVANNSYIALGVDPPASATVKRPCDVACRADAINCDAASLFSDARSGRTMISLEVTVELNRSRRGVHLRQRAPMVAILGGKNLGVSRTVTAGGVVGERRRRKLCPRVLDRCDDA